MNRRTFLRALGIGAGAVAAAPLLSLVPMPKPPGLSVRLVKQWVATGDVARYDVLYGFATLRPELSVRVLA